MPFCYAPKAPPTCRVIEHVRRFGGRSGGGFTRQQNRTENSLAPPGAPAFARYMNRSTRLAVRLLAIGVIVVGAVVLLPEVLGGLERLLRIIRVNWWLVVLVALAVWTLLALGKKR